jgi:hypothetical protein
MQKKENIYRPEVWRACLPLGRLNFYVLVEICVCVCVNKSVKVQTKNVWSLKK